MLISEVINSLRQIENDLGDVTVYFGSLYQDVAVEDVIIEDGYPLIYASNKPGL